ncbi:MAG TPA: 3'-5' exoribonuclease YhaM family protein [Planctomycetota bacterium]|nr:3'-5' exoribonuclease YhaM family protein [Planctomycetota bacterium]
MARLGDLFPDDLQPQTTAKGAPPRPRAAGPVVNAPRKAERVCVKDFVAGQEIEGIYLVSEATIRVAKNGSKYIQATFADKTGTVPVRQWDATETDFTCYKVSGYIKVRGRVETYKNAMQMIAFSVQECSGEGINAADFLPVSVRPLDEMDGEFDALLETFKDPDYKRLLVAIFSDPVVRAKFRKGPAAASVHHAWIGGLMEHVLSACKTAQAIAEQRPFLNRDLLMAGVILHDIGKIEELDSGPGFSYTDTGKLCGHIVLGALLVERTIVKLGDFPQKKRDLILHMILSHHGTHEFGSPVTPVTGEAVALHHLECLDAKVQGIQSIIERERASGNDSSWSEFARVVDGRIYKDSAN